MTWLILPAVFLIPQLAGPLTKVAPMVERERERFDSVFAQYGIRMEVKHLVSFETDPPLTKEVGDRLVAFGPLPEPGTPPLSGDRPSDEREFLDRLAATMALAAKRFSGQGFPVFYLDPLLTTPGDHYGYSDEGNQFVVIGASEGTSPEFWRKVVAHEIGHLLFGEYNDMNGGNLMTEGYQETLKPSFKVTPDQCAKARRYIQNRWPS